MIFNSYNSLFSLIIDEEKALIFALEFNLIKRNRICECNTNLIWSKDVRQKLGYRFRCSNNLCKKTYLILHGTWFYKAKLSLQDQILMIYCYCMEMSPLQLTGMFGLGSGHTSSDWNNYFRDVCAIHLLEMPQQKIGGNELIVEIDKTKIFKNKNNVGRLTREQETCEWVFGGICRETKETFFTLVQDRKRNTLMQLIENNVNPGTHIISDSWRSYWHIEELGYRHSMINHFKNFIDEMDNTIHTQTIERTWKGLKENIPKASRYSSRSSYIIQYGFKKKTGWYNMNSGERFSLLLNLIALYY